MESNEQQVEEAALVSQAREGDEAAFGELVKMHNDRVYHVAYRFANNADDANDLAQQTWIKAWNKIGSFKGKARFYTWVYRICVFVCLDHLRKRKRDKEVAYLDELDAHREAVSEGVVSTEARPDRHAQQSEIQERFQQALERLPPKHRAAMMLREIEGLSYEEIARVMKCRKGTVMSRIHYARKRIQEELKDLQ